MNLRSVRDLKAELTAGIQEQALAESFALLSTIGEPARSPSRSLAGKKPKQGLPDGIVLGVAPGESGEKDGRKLAVRFQAHSEEAVRFGHYVLGKTHGEADIQYVGEICAGQPAVDAATKFQKKTRPLRNGYSIGHYLATAGTLGAFVKNAAGTVGVLSNNHVLGNINQAKKGDNILQQGPADGGIRSEDFVGSFAALIKLLAKGNKVDAAWATIQDHVLDPTLFKDYGGKTRGGLVKADDLVNSQRVWKIGRTTGPTGGTITAVELDRVVVGYPDFGNASFDGQFEVTGDTGPFSAPGDSGSLILDQENRALGLLFGGSTTGGPKNSGRTFASPLETVLALLHLELA